MTDAIKEAATALEPFAREADNHDRPDIADNAIVAGDLTFGDLRRARAALHALPIRDAAIEEAAKRVLALADNEGVATGDGKLVWREAIEDLRRTLSTPTSGEASALPPLSERYASAGAGHAPGSATESGAGAREDVAPFDADELLLIRRYGGQEIGARAEAISSRYAALASDATNPEQGGGDATCRDGAKGRQLLPVRRLQFRRWRGGRPLE